MRALKRLLLRLVFGKNYDYFRRTLCYVPMRGSHYVDIVVRIGGRDRRVEADWLKKLQGLFLPPPKFKSMPPTPPGEQHEQDAASPAARP